MSTNSTISIQHKDGDIETVYCHWDGYLQHNGQVLYAMYDTPEKVQELINHGDMSSLDINIGEQINMDDLNDNRRRTNLQCSFYHRDRGEELEIGTLGEDVGAEQFNYLFDERDNTWYLLNDGLLNDRTPLIDAIKADYNAYLMEDNEYAYLYERGMEMSMGYKQDAIPLEQLITEEQMQRFEEVNAEIMGIEYQREIEPAPEIPQLSVEEKFNQLFDFLNYSYNHNVLYSMACKGICLDEIMDGKFVNNPNSYDEDVQSVLIGVAGGCIEAKRSDILERLAENKDDTLRSWVVGCTAEMDVDDSVKNRVYEKIISDTSERNSKPRAEVAKQGYALERLISDNSYHVRAAVAEQGYKLDVLIDDVSPKVRAAVAEQGYGLDVLYHDIDSEVKSAARAYLKDHDTTLTQWKKDSPDLMAGDKNDKETKSKVER